LTASASQIKYSQAEQKDIFDNKCQLDYHR